MAQTPRLPNFLHVGPGKSGSTWLHEVLIGHPEVFLTAAKDLYYFSRYYDRGAAWYASHFRDANERQRIVGEVCPDYLVSPLAPERIHSTLGPDISLMVTLRDPVERAFSSYLYLGRHGIAAPTFRETLQAQPGILDEGRYGTLLQRYLKYFDTSRVHVATFDDLEADPQRFLDDVTSWLGIAPLQLDEELRQPRLPASAARHQRLASLAQHTADWVRRHDGAKLVGRIKRSSLVQRALYRPLGADRPQVSPEDAAYVREELSGEVETVEEIFGLPLRKLWRWQ
jgi:Sulfotransferase domain